MSKSLQTYDSSQGCPVNGEKRKKCRKESRENGYKYVSTKLQGGTSQKTVLFKLLYGYTNFEQNVG
jgi:hypothetical protein